MNVLEKILEEIESLHNKILKDKFAEQVTEQEIYSLIKVKEIVRYYMDEAKDTNVPSNDGWIPVEERLPEETTGRYYPEMIVTTSYGAVTWGFYRVMDKQWYIYSNIHNEFVKAGDKEIVAWQPLPEPYKPKK
ncbi:MAG: DUF551 domain-containing protein [Coprococcus sp.]